MFALLESLFIYAINKLIDIICLGFLRGPKVLALLETVLPLELGLNNKLTVSQQLHSTFSELLSLFILNILFCPSSIYFTEFAVFVFVLYVG